MFWFKEFGLKKLYFSLLFLALSFLLSAKDFYWVGGSGDWNQPQHWSLTSGGAGYAGIPSVSDNVIFDNSSFTNHGQDVFISSASVCQNFINKSSFVFNLKGNKTSSLEIRESFYSHNYFDNNFSGDIIFTSSKQSQIKSSGITYLGNLVFNNTSGKWVLLDNIEMSENSKIQLKAGKLDFAGNALKKGGVEVEKASSTELDISGSELFITSVWDVSSSKLNFISTPKSLVFVNYGAKKIDNGSINTSSFNYQAKMVQCGTSPGEICFDATAYIKRVYNGGFHVSCKDSCNGSVSIRLRPCIPGGPTGVGPFSFQWLGGPSDSVWNTACAGTQIALVTDLGQSPNVTCAVQVTLTDPARMSVFVLNRNNPSCFGVCDGFINTTAIGGTSPYVYSWSPTSQNTPNAVNLCAGLHTLSIVDANNCTFDSTFVVIQPPQITMQLDSTPTTCSGSCDGVARVISTSGGSGVYVSYQWNDPLSQTGTTATGLCPGVYTVTVTDNSGCTAIDSIEVTQPLPITFTRSQTNASCGGVCDGSATVNVTGGGQPPYTHNWSNGVVFVGASSTISNLCAGVYSDTLRDAAGCDTIITFTITEPLPLTTSSNSYNVDCFGACTGAIKTTPSGGTPGYSYLWSPGGQTTDSISNLCPNTYIVTVTDTNGCTATDTIVITEPPLLNANPTGTDPTCSGLCNGSATANPTGGTLPYSYSWFPGGQTSQSINSLCAGQYIVTVTDSNGCVDVDTVNIVNPPVLQGNITRTNVTCNGLCDGTAKANISGGTPPYSYVWSPGGQTTDSISGLCPGNYFVTITDANGCQISLNTTITQPNPININLSVVNATCNGACDGSASVAPTGGLGPYTVLWNPGSLSGNNVNNLCPGNYTVTVTDANGCQVTQNFTITNPPIINYNLTAYDVRCNGDCNGAADIDVTGGVPPITYLWSPGGQTTDSISGLCAGTYVITIRDGSNCVLIDSVTVNEPDTLQANAVATQMSCNGICDGTATVFPTGGTAPYTFLWAPGGQTTQSINGLCAGNYSVTVTDANGCTDVQLVTVINPPVLTGTTSQFSASCGAVCDGIANVMPSGGTPPYSYQWNDPLNQTTQTATGLCAGTYVIVVTDSTGCTYTDSVTINNLININVNADTIKVSCNGNCDGQATANAAGGTPPYTYVWNPSGQTGPTATGLCPGTYTVTATDINGCQTTVNVTIPTAPNVLVNNSNFTNVTCNGLCDGSASASPTGGFPPYTYSWFPGGQTTPSISNLCPGVYAISVTDSAGCVQTDTIVITQPDTISMNPTIVNVDCNGNCNGSISLSPTGGVGPYTYLWSPGGQTSSSISGLCAGSYTVTVTDANGCAKTVTYTVTQPGGLNTNPVATGVSCNGACDGTASVNVSGGSAPYTFFWSPGGQTTQTITPVCGGSYSVLVTDSNGCSRTQIVVVPEPNVLLANVSGTNPSCSGNCNGSVTANPTGGTAPYTYLWSPGGQTTQTVSNLCAGNYTVTVTDANGCTSTQTVTLNVPTALSVTLSSTNATCNGVCDGTATATVSGGTPPFTYLWTPGNFTTPTVNGLCPGNYSVTVTDSAGCFFTGSVTINQPTLIDDNEIVTNASCGFCDGVITVVPTGGTPPYTYLWSPGGQTTATITNLCPGLYTVTITDLNGCSRNFTIPLSNANGPTGEVVTVIDASCNGTCDGSANVLPIGGQPPYTYLWNPGGQTTPSVTNLCAGNYFVTITDANGCIRIAPISVNEPDTITSNLSIVNETCFGSCNGSASVNPSGGTGPYTIVWNPSGTPGNNIGGLCSGNYSVTITDANGCSKTENFSVSSPNSLTVNISSTNAQCGGVCNGSATATPSGGTGPYTYLWSPGGQTTQTVNNLCAGNYSVTVTDANGCSGVQTVVISEPSAIDDNEVITNANCGLCDGSITVNPSGGTAPYSFLWSNSATSATVNGLCAGVYTVTITDANGCSQVFNIPVSNVGGPTTSSTVVNASCNGVCDGSATVSVSGGTAPYSYLWIPGGFTTPSASGLCAGTYNVQVTDANGCVTIETITITDNSSIVVNVNPIDATCNGNCDGAATASASGGVPPYSYLWSNSATGNAVSGLCAGSYSVTVTDANGCSATQTFTINQSSSITIPFTRTNATCNGSCDGQITVNPTGGTSSYSYLWSPGGQTTQTVSGLCAGSYSVTVTDANGCTANTSITIVDGNAITATFNNTNATCGQCDGVSIVTPGGGSGAPYSFLWSPGGQTNDTISNLCPGSYSVTITDNLGCNQTFISLISNVNGPTLTMGADSVSCYGSCDGLAYVSAVGNSPFNYQWNDPLLQTNDTASALCAGTYSVVVQDVSGCITVDTVTVNEPSQIQGNLTKTDPSCVGVCDGTATANPSGGSGAGYTYLWSPGGQTTPSINGLCPGTYVVVITDNTGCSETDSITLNPANPLSVSININHATCNGNCDGNAQAIVSGGTPPYSYSWNPSGQTGPLAINLCAGNYTLTVTDQAGCTQNINFSINEPTLLSTTSNVTNESCPNSCDGQITTNPSGGTAPYSYMWSNGGTTQTISNLCAGTYSVIVVDSNGCVAYDTLTVTPANQILDNTVVTNATCGLCDGTATANPSGGSGNYSYLWMPGSQATQTAVGLCAGVYTLYITDNVSLCLDSFTIIVNNANGPLDSIAKIDESCVGTCNGQAMVYASGGTPPYTYLWTPGNQTNDTITGLCAGTYIVQITDANNCSSFDTVTIVSSPLNVAILGSVDVLCNGDCNGNATALASGGTSPYNYSWSPVGQVTQTAINLCAGSYTVTATDANNCSGSSTVVINEPAVLVANPSVLGNATCFGSCNGSATANPTGGTAPYSYLWSNSSTAQNITNLCAGTYTVTVTDANGCTSIDSVTITEASQILANPVTTNPNCGICDGVITLAPSGGTGPYTYLWSPGGQTTQTISSLCAGVYSVTITDANGCTANFTFGLSNNNGPVATTTVQDVSCFGTCNGSISVNVSSGNPPYTYLWDDPNAQTTATATGLCAGIYNVIIRDVNNCITVLTDTVNEPTQIQSNISATNILCANDCNGTALVNANGGTPGYTYLWSPGGQTTPSISNLCAGTYIVTITDANGCSVVDSISVNAPNPLLIDSVSVIDVSCSGACDGVGNVFFTGGVGPFSYNWTPGGQSTQLAGGLCFGSNTVTVTDANGCTASLTFNVGAQDTVIADAGNDTTLCFGEVAMLNGFVQGQTSFEWFELPSNTSLGSNLSINLGALPAGTHCYVLYATNTVCDDYDTICITVNPAVNADAGPDTKVIKGNSVQLSGSGGNSYLWSPPTWLTDSTIANPTSTPDSTITYYLTVISPDGCVGYDSVTIEVIPQIKFPDGISPNGDGKNDTWVISFIEQYPNAVVEIYNRWGEMLYRSEDYKNDWDGTYKGKPLPVGTYYYIIEPNEEGVKPFTGPITIMR